MKADQIKTWRQARNLSQSALAALLKVDVMTVSRWERNEREAPSFLSLALEALGQKLKGKGRR